MEVGDAQSADDRSELVVHDEKAQDPYLAYMMGNMRWPEYPEALGVFRAVRKPTYDELLMNQITHARQSKGEGKLKDLIFAGERWHIGG